MKLKGTFWWVGLSFLLNFSLIQAGFADCLYSASELKKLQGSEFSKAHALSCVEYYEGVVKGYKDNLEDLQGDLSVEATMMRNTLFSGIESAVDSMREYYGLL
jgi:hypothetical protein